MADVAQEQPRFAPAPRGGGGDAGGGGQLPFSSTAPAAGSVADTSPSGRPILPVAVLVHTALSSEANLDFPQVTEICERLEANPLEIDEAVSVLVVALGESGEVTSRRKLRALTISNEMMYSPEAVEAFRTTPGLREALFQLRGVRGSDLGAVTDENVRMLATEIERVVFSKAFPTPGTSGAEQLLQGLQQATFESNLEKLERARQKAQQSFSRFGKKATGTMKKAWEGLMSVDLPDAALRPGVPPERMHPERIQPERMRDLQRARQRQRQRARLTPEDEEAGAEEDRYLQWALNASRLEEEARQRRAAQPATGQGPPTSSSSSAGAAAQQPGGDDLVGDTFGGDLVGFMGDVSQRLTASEAREKAARRELNKVARHSMAAEREDDQLLEQFEISEAILAELVERLSVAETELESAEGRFSQLQARVAHFPGQARVRAAALVPRLRAYVAELEARCQVSAQCIAAAAEAELQPTGLAAQAPEEQAPELAQGGCSSSSRGDPSSRSGALKVAVAEAAVAAPAPAAEPPPAQPGGIGGGAEAMPAAEEQAAYECSPPLPPPALPPLAEAPEEAAPRVSGAVATAAAAEAEEAEKAEATPLAIDPEDAVLSRVREALTDAAVGGTLAGMTSRVREALTEATVDHRVEGGLPEATPPASEPQSPAASGAELSAADSEATPLASEPQSPAASGAELSAADSEAAAQPPAATSPAGALRTQELVAAESGAAADSPADKKASGAAQAADGENSPPADAGSDATQKMREKMAARRRLLDGGD